MEGSPLNSAWPIEPDGAQPEVEAREQQQPLAPVLGETISPPEVSANEMVSPPLDLINEELSSDHATRLPRYANRGFLQHYIPSTEPDDHGAKTFRNRLSK